MTSLVRASIDTPGTMDPVKPASAHHQGGLTEKEIYGNMFVFNFAGHDTTAHTLAFAMVILSAHPSVQDWLSQELQHVLGDTKPEDWGYTQVFPRLKRCLAVLVGFENRCWVLSLTGMLTEDSMRLFASTPQSPSLSIQANNNVYSTWETVVS